MRIFQSIGYVRLKPADRKLVSTKWSNYTPKYYTGTSDGWGSELTILGRADHAVMVF